MENRLLPDKIIYHYEHGNNEITVYQTQELIFSTFDKKDYVNNLLKYWQGKIVFDKKHISTLESAGLSIDNTFNIKKYFPNHSGNAYAFRSGEVAFIDDGEVKEGVFVEFQGTGQLFYDGNAL